MFPEGTDRASWSLSTIIGIVSAIYFLNDVIGWFEMLKEINQGYTNTPTRVLVLLGMLIHVDFYITLAQIMQNASIQLRPISPVLDRLAHHRRRLL